MPPAPGISLSNRRGVCSKYSVPTSNTCAESSGSKSNVVHGNTRSQLYQPLPAIPSLIISSPPPPVATRNASTFSLRFISPQSIPTAEPTTAHAPDLDTPSGVPHHPDFQPSAVPPLPTPYLLPTATSIITARPDIILANFNTLNCKVLLLIRTLDGVPVWQHEVCTWSPMRWGLVLAMAIERLERGRVMKKKGLVR